MNIISAKWADTGQSTVSIIIGNETHYVTRGSGDSYDQMIDAYVASGGFIGLYVPIVVPFSADAVKVECSNRIYTVAGATTQMNMTAYIASGTASDTDKATFISSLSWVAAMRAACQSLIAASDLTFAQDNHWPACPADVLALVAKF